MKNNPKLKFIGNRIKEMRLHNRKKANKFYYMRILILIGWPQKKNLESKKQSGKKAL